MILLFLQELHVITLPTWPRFDPPLIQTRNQIGQSARNWGLIQQQQKLHIDNTLPLSWILAMLLKITNSRMLDSNKCWSVAIPLSYPGAPRHWCRSTQYVNLLRVCIHVEPSHKLNVRRNLGLPMAATYIWRLPAGDLRILNFIHTHSTALSFSECSQDIQGR